MAGGEWVFCFLGDRLAYTPAMFDLALSEKQKSIIAAALTTISLAFIVGILLWLCKQLLIFVSYFSGIFLPLAVAAILATLLKPLFAWAHQQLKSRTLALVLVLLVLMVPTGLFFYYFGGMLLGQLSNFLAGLPGWVERVQGFIQEKLPVIRDVVERYDLKARIMGLLEGRTDLVTSSAAMLGRGVLGTGSAVFSSLAGVLGWLVLPIYFIYMIQAPTLQGKDMETLLPFLRPETRKNVIYLVSEFVSILVAFFRGQLVIALCQGALFAVGFAGVGLSNGMILGLILGLLNIVPYLGNIVGLVVVIPLAWFQPGGGLPLLMGLGVVFVLVQTIESYLLTPRIMGKTTGLHPMAIIFAILFWGTAFGGLLGMIMAIPLTAFLVVFWRLLKAKYIQEWF
jgi:predicted PurR-regulated permease PerM